MLREEGKRKEGSFCIEASTKRSQYDALVLPTQHDELAPNHAREHDDIHSTVASTGVLALTACAFASASFESVATYLGDTPVRAATNPAFTRHGVVHVAPPLASSAISGHAQFLAAAHAMHCTQRCINARCCRARRRESFRQSGARPPLCNTARVSAAAARPTTPCCALVPGHR